MLVKMLVLIWVQAAVILLAAHTAVILLPAHPASFAHKPKIVNELWITDTASFAQNFVSGMQSFYFSESQDAIVLQTCH